MDANKRTRILSTVGIIVIAGALLFAGWRMVGNLGARFDGVFGRDRGALDSSSSADIQSDSAGGRLTVPLTQDFAGFKRITTQGGWRVIVTSGAFDVEVTASERVVDDVRVVQRGDGLTLSIASGFGTVTGNMEARISMPDLEQLEMDGGADVQLTGLSLDRLRIDVDGAASVKGVDTTVQDLEVEVDGASNIDFMDGSVVNARVDMAGASNLKIMMAGGRLTGVLRGVGNVTYSGTVSEESVRVEGLGNVNTR